MSERLRARLACFSGRGRVFGRGRLSGAVGGFLGYSLMYTWGSSAVGRGEFVGGAIYGEALSGQHSMTDSTPPTWGCARAAPTPAQGAARIAPGGSTAAQQGRTNPGRAHCQQHAGGGREGTEGARAAPTPRWGGTHPRPQAQRRKPTQKPPCVVVPLRARRAGGKGP